MLELKGKFTTRKSVVLAASVMRSLNGLVRLPTKAIFCKTCKTTRLKMGQTDKCVCCSRLKCSWARLETDPGYSKRFDEMSVSILIQWVDEREQKPLLTYVRNFSLQKYGEAADTTIKSATVDTDCRMAMLEVDQPRGSTYSVKVDWATGSTNLWAYISGIQSLSVGQL